MKNAKFVYRALVATLAWFGLITQYVIVLSSGEYDSVAATTFSYFGYLTVWSNLLVALAVTIPLIGKPTAFAEFSEKAGIRAAVLLYISFVGISFHILLAHLYQPEGMEAVANFLMHTLIPILYFADWVVFSKKRGVSYADIPFWLIFPTVYGFWSITQGLVLGKFPYSFVDVVQFGYPAVLLNMVGFSISYGVGALLIVWTTKFIHRAPA